MVIIITNMVLKMHTFLNMFVMVVAATLMAIIMNTEAVNPLTVIVEDTVVTIKVIMVVVKVNTVTVKAGIIITKVKTVTVIKADTI